MASPDDLTDLLARWSTGDADAFESLVPIVQAEMEKIARRYLSKERLGHTLETGALVNEAYLKLVDQNRVRWEGRSHFFAIAAQSMRRILVDYARARGYVKRGGEAERVDLEIALGEAGPESPDVIAIDDALKRLAEKDPQRASIVELSFFGGLTHPEIAEVLGMSLSSVERSWRLARAWLYKTLG